MKGEKIYAKYGSIAVAMLTVLTVFSVMAMASAQAPSQVYTTNVQTLTKTVTINMNDVRYVSGPTGHYIVVKGLRLTGLPGSPMIPVKNMQFVLPRNAKVLSVNANTGMSVNYGFAKISPARAPVLKDGYKMPAKFASPAINKKVYETSNFYPQKDMLYSVDKTMNATVVDVHLFPVKYNPVSGRVVVSPNMKVTVTYQQISANANTAAVDVSNVIITSPILKAQAQQLADFHNSTGMTSWVVTTNWIAQHYQPAGNPPLNGYANKTTDPYGILNNASLPLIKSMIVGYNYTLAKKIIAFLQNESTGNNVTYVTIFGNARMVPPSYYYTDQEMYIYAYYGYSDFYDAWIPTDAMYASPNYNSTHFDYTPTFMVGRIPVNNMTASAVVNKIIHYSSSKTGGIQNVTLSGGQVFETPYFLGETGVIEPMNYGWLDGTNITEYFHTLRNFTYNNFVKMMNSSDMIVEITHGSGFSFWHHNDEVSAWDFPMKGSYGSLPVYISGSCLNGAWDEEMYPSYEMSSGINGGTSIAEQMLYSPKGIIAYFGADREALGSTYAYFNNGTLVAPNDFGDLITEDGTVAGYYIGTQYYGYATLGLMSYYAKYLYANWVPYLNQRDPMQDGLNDNPWGRSYFEYSLLGDPALQVAGSGPNNPSYKQPQAIIHNANYDANDMPIIIRGTPTTVNIKTTSPKVKAELLYLEQDYGAGYGGAIQPTYYDFILGNTTLSPVSSSNGVNNFTYTFTPNREGIYILSIYGEDGKNTRFYMDCGMPTPPAIHLALKEKKFIHMDYNSNAGISTEAKLPTPDVQVVTLIDNGQVAYGKDTNVTAVVYNSGNATATNVTVQFYLENYTLVFQSENLHHPLVQLGSVNISSLAPGHFAYVTIPWKSVNLWALNHTWDPFNSSARWQYLVANAVVSGNSNSSNANWALFRVHLKLDVWAQKVFLEKDPVYNVSNNVTFELTNVGTMDMSNTTVYIMDDYSIFANITNVKIAPGQTVFYTVPWTPKHPGNDDLAIQAVTPGDNNSENDVGMYYTNGYYSVSNFVVMTYDVAPVNASVKLTNNGSEIGVQIYNYGPLTSNTTKMKVYEFGGIASTDVESPHPYPNNYDHTWEIDAPFGAPGMALHFAYLDVEPGYDYVYIYNQSMSLVASYTGFYNNMWSNYIPGSKLYVRLVSDEYVNYTGFKIDAIATASVYIGNVTFAPLSSGNFASKTLNYTKYTIGGEVAIKMVSTTPGEYATLTTGGAYNNMNIVPYFVPDTTTPEFISHYPTGVVNSREPLITFSYYDKVYSGFKYINVTIDGINVPSYRIQASGINYGNITAEVPFMLADGEHMVTVTLVDGSGNTNTTSWTFTVDAIAPNLTISSPINVPLTYSSSFWINGTTDPGANVTINGVSVAVDSTGSFTYQTTLAEGQNVFTVTAQDAYGNTKTVIVTALYLPQLPQLWAQIDSLNAEINNLTTELNTLQQQLNALQGQVNSLQTQLNNLSAQLNSLQTQLNNLKSALSENVTALNNAIKENRTAMINMIENNVTALNKKISDINGQITNVKSTINDVQAKNKEQDNGISTSDIIGIVGVILALIAIGIAAVSIKKGGKSRPAAPAEYTGKAGEEPDKDISTDEETEEEGLEDI